MTQKPINLIQTLNDLRQLQEQLSDLSLSDHPELNDQVESFKRRIDHLQKQLVQFDRYFKDTIKIQTVLRQ